MLAPLSRRWRASGPSPADGDVGGLSPVGRGRDVDDASGPSPADGDVGGLSPGGRGADLDGGSRPSPADGDVGGLSPPGLGDPAAAAAVKRQHSAWGSR